MLADFCPTPYISDNNNTVETVTEEVEILETSDTFEQGKHTNTNCLINQQKQECFDYDLVLSAPLFHGGTGLD